MAASGVVVGVAGSPGRRDRSWDTPLVGAERLLGRGPEGLSGAARPPGIGLARSPAGGR
jgi:hypothetical protein